ncbi:MAG: hypothetical protein A4E28_01671 [Methanocella sp. PtaU1.Bin125]|nr:MAG: hypothetical protein A4E28_01671 [Methanocella sp. PtaU1.Bin125]
MGLRSLFSLFIVLALLLGIFGVCAQEIAGSKQVSNALNIDDALSSMGLPDGVRIIKVNDVSSVTMDDPLVILGSGIDSVERQLFDAYKANNEVNASYVLYDSTRTFQKQSIELFDLVVIGGPMHNAYTKELLNRRVLTYATTDVKAACIVVEVGKLPGGRTVVVIGSVAGYPYQSGPSPLPGNTSAQNQSSPQNVTTTDAINQALLDEEKRNEYWEYLQQRWSDVDFWHSSGFYNYVPEKKPPEPQVLVIAVTFDPQWVVSHKAELREALRSQLADQGVTSETVVDLTVNTVMNTAIDYNNQ